MDSSVAVDQKHPRVQIWETRVSASFPPGVGCHQEFVILALATTKREHCLVLVNVADLNEWLGLDRVRIRIGLGWAPDHTRLDRGAGRYGRLS